MNRTPRHMLGALAVSAMLLASCSSSDGDSNASDTTKAPGSSTTTTAKPATKLKVLVVNDDGYQAEGIDAVVEGLRTLPDVEITVVAPLEQQSGTGGKTTDGALKTSEVKLKSGFAATAVDGFPSDSVRAAFDDLKLDPDVVVSGINEGQNLGPAADLSGTVGAARAAVAKGVPALAVSQGTGGVAFDYPVAVTLVLDWVQDQREALEAGKAPVQVDNINVPSCTKGELRGLAEVKPDLGGDLGKSLKPQDCTSVAPLDRTTMTDVEAFLIGYATHSLLPSVEGGK